MSGLTMTASGVCAVVALALTAPAANGETQQMSTYLAGEQEVPPVDTEATGAGRFTIDTTANTLDYHVSYSGLSADETAAHIHGPADIGVNAGVLHPLPAGNPKVGTWNYPEEMEDEILNGRMYVNVHTTAHQGGEIRGQIVDMVAVINGTQENPSVDTPDAGYGLFMLDRCANTLEYHITYSLDSGAVETAAHIHGFAMHGTNAGVIEPLPADSPKEGVWNYNESDELRILDGHTYVNIHSKDNPGGHIRGQIVSTMVPMDGEQETPPVDEPGHGLATIAIDTDTNNLSYYVETHNLTGPLTGSHIHGFAPPGEAAGVLHSIGAVHPVVGVWAYDEADEADIVGGQTYINSHTDDWPAGEVRGQIEFPLPPCLADVNCDSTVNTEDLLQLLANWGDCDDDPAPCASDINKDGTVGTSDLLDLLAGWGDCP